jgi:hypothetical protein
MEESLKPYVVVDGNRNTGIFLVRGRKFVRIIARDPHFRIVRMTFDAFDGNYRPLTQYSNGAPSGVPYDLQTAARKYLEYGRNAGITEGALRCLKDIIIRGNISMTTVESAQRQEETVTSSNVPKLEKLSDALSKASSKNGADAETSKQKKAAKARKNGDASAPSNGGSNSTQENSMNAAARTATKSKSKPHGAVVAKSVKGDKIAGEKKPAASKKAPATKKTPVAKKPATTKKAAATDGRGRSPKINDEAVLTYVADNPKRKGTEAFRKFAVYKVGMKIGDVVKKNVDRADINYNLERGFIKVKGA